MRSRDRQPARRALAGFLAALAVAACALAAASPASAQVRDWNKIKYPGLRPFQIPEPERYTMDNGIRVLLIEDHELPMIQLQAWIHTGSRLEPADKTGLASITGTVMRTGGAGSRTGDEIDDWLDARGAQIETGIGTTAATAGMSCLEGDFPEVLKVFADILRRPRFEDQKIKVAKTQMMAGIARRNDDQQGIMRREIGQLIYGEDSPYARDAEYATVGAVTRDDLDAFHGKYFIPNRVLIGVVGDFDTAAMKETLRSVLGDWKKGPEFKDAEAAIRKAPVPGVYYVDKQDVTQSAIILGHLGIREDDPDYYAVEVMNQVLSGSFAARLFNNIRTTKGLAYSVRGGISSNFDYPGTFNIWLTTKTETTAAAIDAMLAEVDALLAAPPTEVEMERAKEAMLNSFVFNYDTRSKILNQQLALEYYGYPKDFLTRYQENVGKVTAEDVFQASRRHVRKDDIAILVVGKTDGMDRPLASFGDVKTIDISIPEPAAASSAIASAPGMGDEEAKARGKMVFDKMLAATGDAAAVDGVKSLRFEASVTAKTPAGEMELKVTNIFQLPDHVRQEMQTPMGAVSVVASPEDAFTSTPMGVQPLSGSRKEELLKSLRRQQIALLQARKSAGFEVRYAGSETIEGIECDKIAVTSGGETSQLAVDAATGKLVRTTHQGMGPQGVPGEVVTYYSDYRDASGLSFPHAVRQTFNGEPAVSMKILEVGVNEKLDAAQFARPAGAGSGESSGTR